jgi:hypothetical protein
LIGDINKYYLLETIDKAQKDIGKKIKYLIFSKGEAKLQLFEVKEYLLIWNN